MSASRSPVYCVFTRCEQAVVCTTHIHTHVIEFGFTCSSLLFNVRIAEFRPAVCDLRVRSLTRSSVKPYSFASVAMAANRSGSVSGLACRTVLYSDDCVWDLSVAKTRQSISIGRGP